MKKVILCLLVIALTFSVNAQEKGKIRVGLGLGLGLPANGAGFGGDLDIRYNIMDNINAGIKFTGDMLMKDIAVDQINNTASVTAGVIGSTLATGDYYFTSGKSIFAPYVGAGLGIYSVLNMKITASGSDIPTTPSTAGLTSQDLFGGLIRGGFELGHFRMGLEYYLVPNSSLYDVNTGLYSGTTNNSFLRLSLGFYFGGGHWKK